MGDARRGFRVEGRVQGVGFRWWTSRLARDQGVLGRVWNCVDGSVRVDLAGSASAVERVGAALENGPPMATVTSVTEVPFESTATMDGFAIGPPEGSR